MSTSWRYFQNTGVVNDACIPYPFQGTSYDKNVYNDQCPSTCMNNTSMSNRMKVSSYKRLNTVEDIQRDLMANGPVHAAYTVYKDFFSYNGGVYTQTSNTVAGGHAVEIVGWGTQNNKVYWTIKNSWGAGWGMKGFFNIYADQCGISNSVWSGVVDAEDWVFMDPNNKPSPGPNDADSHCT